MRPEHRHELKTNELAEWMNNLPEWFKENRTTIILILATILAAAAFYLWKSYRKTVLFQQQLELTSLVGQIFGTKVEILKNREEGRDVSFILLQPAEGLKDFAQNTKNNQMAGLALIKRAEALRAELHYRFGAISGQELIDQINQAKTSYTEAAAMSSNNPTLRGTAKFGLGLCEEELGNFEQAQQIYSDIIADPNLESTVAAAQAKLRLETMSEYRQRLAFKPAPKTLAVEPNIPTIRETKDEGRETKDETNLPTDVNLMPKVPNSPPNDG